MADSDAGTVEKWTTDDRRPLTENDNGYLSGAWFGGARRIRGKWVGAPPGGEDVAQDGWMEAAHFQFGFAFGAEHSGARRVLVHAEGNPAFAFGA
jgi:hypothetical protein